ncbi:Inner membrane protein YbaN [Methylobrevis pamukkalensis]|uniref:Inner membrane protein YbaN n=1 Tax=Methylobrevis pamukkalensis TaxID=1439726 RepID=A0A1E3H2A8_9HYPH|nr:YbaN family protein [Methylobrevis pamukkalensis]ODN70434.1 Inner membrane protein YbaN [Methylobrevis pamukkalensis]
MQRIFYLIAGCAFVGLAVIGAVLPLLPTTIFVILAAGCFAKSSPRLEAWLLNHRLFGPSIRRWRENHAIPPTAKAMATGGMTIGFAGFLWGAHPSLPVALIAGAAMLACAAYVLTRPSG